MDEATWTEKFDRWWAENYVQGRLVAVEVEFICRAAFMAGAAAERIERVRDAQSFHPPMTGGELWEKLKERLPELKDAKGAPLRVGGWFAVPEQVATRARARQLREQAVAEGCDVLNFAATEFVSVTAADELVCNGTWTATTGENADVRETVERAQRRRGLIP